METATFLSLALACAPGVDVLTATALVHVESARNPWAIGVVGGALQRQPQNRAEAMATARALQADHWNFSVGLGQINRGNFGRLGLSLESALDPCTNLFAMQTLLHECFTNARKNARPAQPEQTLLRQALSCYYSGDFHTGFAHGYVQRVVNAARRPTVIASPTLTKDTP